MGWLGGRVRYPSFWPQPEEQPRVKRPSIDPEMFEEPYDTPAMEQYLGHLKNIPRPENYQPSKWRRVGAILAGTFSKNPLGTAEYVVHEPYNRATEDWEREGKGLATAASIEERSLGERAYNRSMMLRAMVDLRKSAKDELDAQKTQLEIQRIQQDLERSGFQKHTDAQGIEWMVNPYTKQRIRIGQGTAETPTERATGRQVPITVARIHEKGASDRQVKDLQLREKIAKSAHDLKAWEASIPGVREALDRVSINYPYFRATLDKVLAGEIELTDEEMDIYREGMDAFGQIFTGPARVEPPRF